MRSGFHHGRSAGCGQGILNGVAHGLMHFAAFAKAHFDLGGVYVHIHARWVDLDVQRVNGLFVAVKNVFISSACGMCQYLVAHKAAIDVAELMVGLGARSVGHACAAGDMHGAGPVIDDDGVGDKFLVQHIGQSAGDGFLGRAGGGAPLLDQLAFMPDGKAHIGAGQRVAAHRFNAMRQLGRIGLEEFAAGRGREEQLFDFDRGALIAGGRTQLATAGVQQISGVLPGRAREDRGFRHRGNGGQRLTPETHGGYGFQIMQIGNFAGGMAAQGYGQLVTRNAAAVVFHRNQAHTTGQKAQGDLAGAGVQGVIDQLAHHGCGALHHLAGGDLADQLIGQVANRPTRRLRGRGLCNGFGRGGREFRAGCVHINHSRLVRKPAGE